MRNFRIIPLTFDYAARIRESKKDDFGHEVTEHIANGYGPCRVSLKPFKLGTDTRLLFSYSPFDMDNSFNQTGPIFIHKDPVDAYSDIYQFPPEIKADKKHFPLTLIGYDNQQQMVFTKLVGDRDVDEMIVDIFYRRSEIAYLHARNAEAGCFICKIERVA